MIVSFHPCFEADRNIIVAGRKPNAEDQASIQMAAAVILPQGCSLELYRMARSHCMHLFPNLDAKFSHPGKIGQMRLFSEMDASFPPSECYETIDNFSRRYGNPPKNMAFQFPFIFKFNWGGEGENVFKVDNQEQFERLLQRGRTYERSGQFGFLLQAFVPSGARSLRVVVVGRTYLSYWRKNETSTSFRSNLAKGGLIERHADPELQRAGRRMVADFCKLTRINLAGFDLLFDTCQQPAAPKLLEINYYFGRRGLGGSTNYYALLVSEIEKWLDRRGLAVGQHFKDRQFD